LGVECRAQGTQGAQVQELSPIWHAMWTTRCEQRCLRQPLRRNDVVTIVTFSLCPATRGEIALPSKNRTRASRSRIQPGSTISLRSCCKLFHLSWKLWRLPTRN